MCMRSVSFPWIPHEEREREESKYFWRCFRRPRSPWHTPIHCYIYIWISSGSAQFIFRLMSNNCQKLHRHCRPRRVAGVFERQKSERGGKAFVKSLSSQLRSYRLYETARRVVYRSSYSFYLAIDSSSSWLLASFSFSSCTAPFSIPGPILLCQTSSVCARIGYELFMVSASERASGLWTKKRFYITWPVTPDAIYNRLHERLRFSVWFTLISAPIRRCGGIRKS